MKSEDNCVLLIFAPNQLNTLMEIVAIEAQTFDRMLQRLKDMARITDEICKMHGERKIGGWMDSQDACLRLGVSPRTLQTFRDNGTLAYSRIGHKIYYRVEDIQGILPLIQKRKEKQV